MQLMCRGSFWTHGSRSVHSLWHQNWLVRIYGHPIGQQTFLIFHFIYLRDLDLKLRFLHFLCTNIAANMTGVVIKILQGSLPDEQTGPNMTSTSSPRSNCMVANVPILAAWWQKLVLLLMMLDHIHRHNIVSSNFLAPLDTAQKFYTQLKRRLLLVILIIVKKNAVQSQATRKE